MLTVENFPYRNHFRELDSKLIEATILEMSSQWAGTQGFWEGSPEAIRTAKRDTVLALLVAWHLADLYPEKLEGVSSNGGMPLSSKEGGGVKIEFLPLKVQEAMYPLMTNTFGIRALSMIMSAPERFGIRGRRTTYPVSQSYGTPF